MCNFAGTFQLGASGVNTQSNDLTLNTIFLCFGDSIFIDHNGDADLSGDPTPATPAGTGWAFYSCQPTVMGDNLQTVIGDPCNNLNPAPPAAGIWIYTDEQDGDAWFFNNGALQNTFNGGDPIQLFFAPITLDILNTSVTPSVQGYESSQVGFPPGPCVNVNTAAAFSVVYLNAIQESGVSTNFGDDCLGKFRIEGGYPEFDPTAVYTIDITAANNSSVKALIHTAANQLFHGADVIFSVPTSGTYNVTVEDGKSCGYTFQISMSACDPTENVTLAFPQLVGPPNTPICVPLTVENFNSASSSFSINWDPAVLQFDSVSFLNPTIDPFFTPAANLNSQNTANGFLGVALFDNINLGNPITIPDGDSLFSVCFTIIAPLGTCSDINIGNSPTFVEVTDNIGAALPVTVIAGQVCSGFLPLSATVAVVDPTCLGTASIRVTAKGGTAPYQVILKKQPGGPTTLATINTDGGFHDYTGQTNGTYDIQVVDLNGLGIDTINLTVNLSIPILGASLDLTKLPTCFGLTDGSVSASVFLGSTLVSNPGPNYSFTWTGPNPPYPNAPIITNVGAGAYSVVVSDAISGCSAVAAGTLGQPQPVSDQTILTTPATCSGVCDGTINYEVEGGTTFPGGAYDYNWAFSADGDPLNAVQDAFGQGNPINLTAKCAGTYFVTITDANGCTFTDDLVVNNLRTVTVLETVHDDISCNGQTDGNICVQVTEAPASGNAYTFFWTPAGGSPFTASNTSSCYSNLGAGQYQVVALDQTSGCLATLTMLTIVEPTPVAVVNDILTDPNCGQPNSGKIEVRGSGGVGTVNPASYTYNWDNGASTRSISNLPEGTYCVTVTDANNCTATACYTLTLPEPPQITSVDSTSVKCGNDGCLTVNTIPAPGNITFQWTDLAGTPIPNGTTATVCGLNGGTYIVNMTDQGACFNADTLVLGTAVTMSLSDTSFIEPTCSGLSNGIISVSVVGGNGNYVFNWTPNSTPPSTSGILFGVKAGCYDLEVTDAAGCTLTANICLEEPPQIQNDFPVASVSGTSCFTSCDGTATPVVNYADGTSGSFFFQWSDGSADSLRTDLCAGWNQVTITDINSCFIVDSVEITAPPAVTTSNIAVDSVSCFGLTDGSITVAATGGNGGPFTYQWSPNAGTSASTPVVSNLGAGTYVVTITDNQGCTGTQSITVGTPPQIVVSPNFAETEDPTCFGGDDGQLAVTVTGGNVGALTYSWANATTTIGTLNPQEDLTSGVYSVTVTDANGCTGLLENMSLTDPAPILGSYTTPAPLLCFGDETTLTVENISGGSGGPYTFSVDFGVALSPGFPIQIGGGVHYISYFDGSGVCSFVDTLDILEPDPVTITFDPTTIEIELGANANLVPNISGAVDIETFTWTPANLLVKADTLFPTTLTYESAVYTLNVVDANGCSGTGSIVVNVDPNRNVFIPNIFYPNNPDGTNTHFAPNIGLGVKTVNFMRVFDRWGELVYERTNFIPENQPSIGWDGRYKGEWVQPNVYIYIVEVEFLDGRVLLYRGDVTVVR
jgi:hypothetical protein